MIEAVATLGCSVTAREIADLLRDRGSEVGLASVYRALELLDRIGLVQRFDVGEGTARYEPAHPERRAPSPHRLRHAAARSRPFEDAELERAIDGLAGKTDFTVAAHDVTLHGECPALPALALAAAAHAGRR